MTGVYRAGKIEINDLVDWPEGTEVVSERRDELLADEDDGWPTTKEGIEEMIRRWDAAEPVQLAPAEEAEWEAARAAIKEYTLKKMHERTEGRPDRSEKV